MWWDRILYHCIIKYLEPQINKIIFNKTIFTISYSIKQVFTYKIKVGNGNLKIEFI